MTTQNAVNSTYPFSVANGGTGLATITAHGIMVGEGTSAVNPIVLTNGQMLIGSTGADPAAATITSTGSTITVTPGAGTLNIDLASPVTVAHGGTGLTSITAHGILIGEGTSAITPIVLTAGQVLIGTTSGDPAGATLTQGTGITITSASGSITVASTSAAGGGFVWNDTTGTSATIVAGNAYVSDNAALVTFTLPATAAFGDSFLIAGKGAGGWKLAQAAGQQIDFGSVATTSGTSGYLSSTNQFDVVRVTCVTANTQFIAYAAQGNITYN